MESRPMKKLYDLANIVLLALLTYTVYAGYSKLPERIPTHFNFSGQPDRWGSRSSFLVLAAVAWGMTILFYVLIKSLPQMGRNPRTLNIPHKEEFLKLPAEKQMAYWALLAEFLAGLVAAINLLFYFIIRGILRIATGETSLLSFTEILPAIVVLGLVMLVYFRKLFVMPGKLVRGEE
jgi:uncharacterized membrane protein